MKKELRLLFLCAVLFSLKTNAQVNTVEFGKNRVQYQKFNWKYYQTDNFNTYFSQDGLALGKYVAQVAEEMLPGVEEFVEYGLQRRANIVVYNNFDEFQQSNIGLGIDWQNTGGVTKLVNNKIVLFFDGNHENLKRQVRQGIAKVLVQNVLFGDDLGEFAANQALLDLPEWLTDGYIAYAGENWSAVLDDDLKSALLSGRYNNFYQFAHEKPLLAGHAFWRYIGDKYGKSKTTYMLYLSRIYRNLNAASNRVSKKKFKQLLTDFMTEESQKYLKDIRGRRVSPKGQLAVTEYIKKKDFIRFNANPVPRNMSYAVVEFKQGKYTVILMENFVDRKVLLKFGARSREDEKNPNYPLMAWDGKGTRLAVTYWEAGKTKLFVYDLVNRAKISKTDLSQFSQIEDMKYMLDANTLLFSAVKSGQTDIFVYKIDKGTVEQITNDVYDDLDASFVAFPNKTGIIFSSNRPSAEALNSDDSIPHSRFNIFLVDNWNKSEFKQISQLTDVKQGNARFPSQYNTSHFTFVSNENGIANRYAGFFRTERAGLDTLVYIGTDVLRNPTLPEVDSLLKEWEKPDIDSVGFVSVTNDSTYVFPLTNYQSSLLETRTAGDNQQVSEVVRQGDYKFLYRLRVDENALRRRNISARPTEFMKKVMEEEKFEESKSDILEPLDTSIKKQNDFFQNEFQDEKKDSTQIGNVVESVELPTKEPVLKKAKLFEYRPPKFFNDYVVAGFNNSVLVTRYQTYAGGTGPIRLSNGNAFNGMLRVGTSDLFEDWKFAGGVRIGTDLDNIEYLMSAQYLKKRIDYGVNYYRTTSRVLVGDAGGSVYSGKLFSNLYQANVSYPFNRVRSIRFNAAFRSDKIVILADDLNNPPVTLKIDDIKNHYALLHAEYVHDDAINPAQNIWYGLRYKIYLDWNARINKSGNASADNPYTFNIGADARHYLPIYRNFIWAVRGAFDISFGPQKIIYYLGGVDNDLFPKFNSANTPDPDNDYAYQSLAVNLRGFNQNVSNGNNAVVINSELRLPVLPTLFNKPINNAFLRNFQIVQFFDLGAAWNGAYDKIQRPSVVYSLPNNPVLVKIKAGGIGPFAGGYGFGARSTVLGYFLRVDAAWEMNGFFKGKPLWYFAMGLDF
jgi:Tol biopolymer transport system component